jgi:hypothetical protein
VCIKVCMVGNISYDETRYCRTCVKDHYYYFAFKWTMNVRYIDDKQAAAFIHFSHERQEHSPDIMGVAEGRSMNIIQSDNVIKYDYQLL